MATRTGDRRTLSRRRANVSKERRVPELAAADLLVPGSDSCPHGAAASSRRSRSSRGFPVPLRPAGGAAVSGADGDAAHQGASRSSATILRRPFYTLSRPVAEAVEIQGLRRLRVQIEAVDSPLMLALDAEAAADLASAFELDALGFGVGVVRGKVQQFVACDGLERSLNDERAKARVWRQLMVATPEPPIWLFGAASRLESSSRTGSTNRAPRRHATSSASARVPAASWGRRSTIRPSPHP